MTIRAPTLLTLSGALLFGACAESSGPKVSSPPRRPSATEAVRISDPVLRAGYLEATLEGASGSLRMYFPDDESCRAVLVEGAEGRYGGAGQLGHVAGEAGECDPIGVGSLREWHNRQARPRGRRGLPRANAIFKLIHEDEEFLLLRGRFPLARVLGWAGDDLVVFLPAEDACRPIAEHGVAFMVYRKGGGPVFTLTGADSRDCAVVGFAQPLRR